MAKVCFIIYDNDSYIHWFPTGIAYLASYLLQYKNEVVIYDMAVNHYTNKQLKDYIEHNDFDIVGLGMCGGYYQYNKLIELSKVINKCKNRDSFYYVLGGHLVNPDFNYFYQLTKCDYLIAGEGEKGLLELCNYIGGDCVENIFNSYYLRTVINLDKIDNLDDIPFPAYHLFNMNVYRLQRFARCENTNFVIPMITARGCPYNCNFCYRMIDGYRMRSPKNIIEEIKLLQKDYGINYIYFDDELLMSSKHRAIELSNAFINAKLKFKWACNGRLNFATNDVLKVMKSAGCVFINYGIESLDDTVLKNMNKRLTSKQIIKGIETTQNNDIATGLNIIWGNIGDTTITLSKSVDFLLKYDRCDQLRTIRPVTPYPNSDLFKHCVKQGMIKDVKDFYENKHKNSDLLTVNLTSVPDDVYYECLKRANEKLLTNYYKSKLTSSILQTQHLYNIQDTNFRGYRQT
jgi:radical SAM superfamily enzyme YgiQ (UPF0313 family)